MRQVLFAMMCAGLALGCAGKRSLPGAAASRATHETASSARTVRLTQVAETALARSVVVSGTLAADERVVVSTKVPGRLASIAVDLGSRVTQGEVIAQVETTDYQLRVEQAQSAIGQARALLGLPFEGPNDEIDIDQTSSVRQARATLEEQRQQLERARTLVDQKLIAAAEFDTTEAAFVRAESALVSARDEVRNRQATLRQRRSELRMARQQLADTGVRAPLSGTVQERHATAGEYLAAGAPVATVVRVDPLRMRVEIPEREAGAVRVGQTARITVEGDAAAHAGRVARVAPAFDEQNRTLAVEAELQNPGGLRPGTFARAEIVIADDARVAAVPTSSIVVFAGIEKVITVKDGRAVEKEIKTGRRTAEWTEVVSGIEVGESVVVEPGNLQQGQPVEIASTS
jgi:multidrug efflux pump subunit AcrA (membrane-fusion protein)